MPAMATTPDRWDLASTAAVTADGLRVPEIAQLGPGAPDLATLFTFARDAELRFGALRLRLEERVGASTGEIVRLHEVLLRHPGRARVSTIRPDRPATTGHDVWLGDGETVRIYRSGHRLATTRPVRRQVVGLDGRDLPGTSRPYVPLTALPANTLADTFVHPGGYCQNVLATGACAVTGTGTVAGREVVLVQADHPRTVELAGDRPDHRIDIAVDRETGLLALLVESFGGVVTRRVEATEIEPDGAIPDAAFAVAVPSDASRIY